MIQVNIGAEPSKSGIAPQEAVELASAIMKNCPDIGLCGLMTIPPNDGQATHWFQRMVALQRDIEQSTGHSMPELSMGMSRDLEVAVSAGSTIVRVGTAIFGARPT